MTLSLTPRRATLLPLAALLLLAAGQETGDEKPGKAGRRSSSEQADAESHVKDKTRKELAEGKVYCEYDNCYELLGVKTDSGPIPIKRAYRRLAAEWHPDKCPGGDYEKCKELFPRYANAYEVLSSVEMRKNYDYVLANPYEFPSFYMKYSKPRYAPKSDLRFVAVLTLLAAAGVQYLLKQSMYEQALTAVKKDPRSRYQERLKELVAKQTNASSAKKASGAARGEANSTKHSKTIKPEELEKRKKAAEEELAAELAAELPPPPSITDNVAVALFKAPLTLTYSLLWALNGGMREPAYMTRKALGLSAAEWEALDAEEMEEFLGLKLWVAENRAAYEEEIASSAKSGKGATSSKEKRAARERKRQKNNPSAAVIEE